MLRQMDRSEMYVLAKRGRSIRQIAAEVQHSPTTVARVLREPVTVSPARRRRHSLVDPYREQIRGWIAEGLPAVRMLELARGDAAAPYRGSRSQFGALVQRLRHEVAQAAAVAAVPVRFEGLPGEYLQVDWGEVRAFPFTQQGPATRYFLACRLKYSRWVDMAVGLSPVARRDQGSSGLRTCARKRSSAGCLPVLPPWAGCRGCWSSTI
jgi:hypothetical protein